MKKNKEIKWLKRPQPDHYPAAHSFLRLVYSEEMAKSCVRKLKRASVEQYKAKDIFRASDLSLPKNDRYFVKERKKIRKGVALSPVLLVRDRELGKLVVAEGFHSVCAAYAFDKESVIACKIV